jgi:hypothetical protein
MEDARGSNDGVVVGVEELRKVEEARPPPIRRGALNIAERFAC